MHAANAETPILLRMHHAGQTTNAQATSVKAKGAVPADAKHKSRTFILAIRMRSVIALIVAACQTQECAVAVVIRTLNVMMVLSAMQIKIAKAITAQTKMVLLVEVFANNVQLNADCLDAMNETAKKFVEIKTLQRGLNILQKILKTVWAALESALLQIMSMQNVFFQSSSLRSVA